MVDAVAVDGDMTGCVAGRVGDSERDSAGTPFDSRVGRVRPFLRQLDVTEDEASHQTLVNRFAVSPDIHLGN